MNYLHYSFLCKTIATYNVNSQLMHRRFFFVQRIQSGLFSIFNFNFVVRYLKYCVRHEKVRSMKLISVVFTNLNRVNLELKIQTNNWQH